MGFPSKCSRETWWKTNVLVRPDGQVSYDLVKKFELVPNMSRVSPDALVIIPNIPFFSGAARMKDQDLLTIWGFQVQLDGTSIVKRFFPVRNGNV